MRKMPSLKKEKNLLSKRDCEKLTKVLMAFMNKATNATYGEARIPFLYFDELERAINNLEYLVRRVSLYLK